MDRPSPTFYCRIRDNREKQKRGAHNSFCDSVLQFVWIVSCKNPISEIVLLMNQSQTNGVVYRDLVVAILQEDKIDDFVNTARFSTIRITLSLLPFQSTLIAIMLLCLSSTPS